MSSGPWIDAEFAKEKSPSRLKMRTVGGCSTGARNTTSASRYSPCSRAPPPPVKNAWSVCAASWMTLSPSMRPGQPRSSSRSLGLNMQSFSGIASLGFRVHEHVDDLRTLAADHLLDPAGLRVCLREGRACGKRHRQVHDEPLVGVHELQLLRLAADGVANDAFDELSLGRDLLGTQPCALRLFGQRLEVRLHRRDLRQRRHDCALDVLRDLVRLVERQTTRQLQVQRDLRAGVRRYDAHVVYLTHATDTKSCCVR